MVRTELKIVVCLAFINIIVSCGNVQKKELSRTTLEQDAKNDTVKIINNISDSVYFYFATQNRTGNWIDVDQIKDQKTFFAEFDYIELTQSIISNPMYWCRSGETFHIKTLNNLSDEEFDPQFKLQSNDSVISNEVMFFRHLNDSIFPGYGTVKYMKERAQLSKDGKLLLLAKQDYDKKLIFLEKYKKANPISSSFEELCKTFFFTKYLSYVLVAYNTSQVEDLKKILIDSKDIVFNEKLLFSSAYRRFCAIYNTFLIKNEKPENIINDLEKYSLTKKNTKGKMCDYLLFNIVNSNLNNENSNTLIRQFYVDCQDETYKNYIRSEMVLKEKRSTLNDSILTLELKSVLLEDIIKSCKGKIIYVDFWASWCSPCRTLMKESRKIHKEYADKIIFIYISIDENYAAWQQAVRDELLEVEYAFLAPKGSEILKKYNVKPIPRYLLFDQDGRIVNDNAPRPDDIALKNSIISLLK